MGTSAFILGFFVALGGWTASHITKKIDSMIEPPKAEKQLEAEKETKEKEDVRRD